MPAPDTLEIAPTAAILIIGNEILSGRTQDSNLAWMAGRLEQIGVRLREARVVADVQDEIVVAVRALSARYTYVFTTGGIGPTHDDITADFIAKAFDLALEHDPEAVRRLTHHYGGAENVTPSRLRMARIPRGAALIDNVVSAAPGFRVANVFVMAGVPAIMRAMFDSIAPTLRGGAKMLQRIVTCRIGESMLAEPLAAIQARHAGVEIGSYPFFRQGNLGVSLVARSTDSMELDQAAGEISDMIRSLGDEPVEGE